MAHLKLAGTVAVLVTGLFVTGCSSTPAEREGRDALQTAIARQPDVKIKLTEFKKTNGVEDKVEGSVGYEMDFSAELEFTADCLWNKQLGTENVRPVRTIWTDMDQRARGLLAMSKGDTADIEGTLVLQKTENGWRQEHLEIKRVVGFTQKARTSEAATSAGPSRASAVTPSSTAVTPGSRVITGTVIEVEHPRAGAIITLKSGEGEVKLSRHPSAGGSYADWEAALGRLKPGDQVSMEIDAIDKYGFAQARRW